MRLDPKAGKRCIKSKSMRSISETITTSRQAMRTTWHLERTLLVILTTWMRTTFKPGTKVFNDYVLDAIAEGQMTKDDAKKLRDHDTNMGLEVKSNPEYDFTRQAFRSFSDAVLATVPGIEKSRRAAGEMQGFEGDGSDSRKLDLLFEQELYATQKSYPQDAAGQKAHIDDAAYRAIRRYLSDTEYQDASGETVNLLDKMGDMEGGLDKPQGPPSVPSAL